MFRGLWVLDYGLCLTVQGVVCVFGGLETLDFSFGIICSANKRVRLDPHTAYVCLGSHNFGD